MRKERETAQCEKLLSSSSHVSYWAARIRSQLTVDATKQIDRKSGEIFIIEIRAGGGDVLQGKRTSGGKYETAHVTLVTWFRLYLGQQTRGVVVAWQHATNGQMNGRPRRVVDIKLINERTWSKQVT